MEDMNGAKVPVKTCYKCKTDGHVCFSSLLVFPLLAVQRAYTLVLLQIARDCPEGREPVEEEDNAWGEEAQEDNNPWGGGSGFPAV
jgi:hypothetical protein